MISDDNDTHIYGCLVDGDGGNDVNDDDDDTDTYGQDVRLVDEDGEPGVQRLLLEACHEIPGRVQTVLFYPLRGET